jgi:hypothetical protein
MFLCGFNSEHRKMRAKQQHGDESIYDQYQPEMDSKFRHRIYRKAKRKYYIDHHILFSSPTDYEDLVTYHFAW